MAKQAKELAAKIAVLNFSGNVGKSTVSRHLLMPNMKDPVYVPVESINADEGEGETVRGTEWGRLQEDLMFEESVVVDIGASNVEPFMRLMNQYRGSHEEFDYFVIPAVSDSKQIRDTLATIDALHEMGVPKTSIRVVFNRVALDDVLQDDFHVLFNHHADTGYYMLNANAWIEYSEVYPRMRALGLTLDDVLADKTDWRAIGQEAKAKGDQDRMYEAQSMVSLIRLARSARDNLAAAFAALMAPEAKPAKPASAAATTSAE